MQINYTELTQRIYPRIIPMIFCDKYECLYDKPLGVQIALYTIGNQVEGIADMEFGGNVINIKLPAIVNLYNKEQLDQETRTDQIVTDIVAALIHESFHINQDIDLYQLNHDLIYRNEIEKANMAASDKWMLNHIMQLNQIVVQSHPLYYGINMSRVMYEYNLVAQDIDRYKTKDMEQAVFQKLNLIFPYNSRQILEKENARLIFSDGSFITLKKQGLYDCDQIINDLTKFNRLLYGLSHGLPKLECSLVNYANDIDCMINTDWDTVISLSFNEFDF